MRVAFISISLLATLQATPPKSIDPLRPALTRLENADGFALWHSRRFEIRSEIDIPPSQLSRLAKVADTTARAIEAFNPQLYTPPDGKRLRLAILGSDQSFLREGGRLESAGMYLWRKKIVILHAKHLFRSPAGSRLKPAADEDLIVHEISHLCMHGVQPRLPHWLNEGLAEYFASAHLGGGRFRFNTMEGQIRDHLKRRNDSVDPRIRLSPVGETARLDSSQAWTRHLNLLPAEKRLFPYATALLLTHYHLHGGPDRTKMLDQALARKSPKDANPFRPVADNAESIEQSMLRFWKPKGLQPDFGPSE